MLHGEGLAIVGNGVLGAEIFLALDGEEAVEGLSYHEGAWAAEELFGGFVAGEDDAVAIEGEDGFGQGVQNC